MRKIITILFITIIILSGCVQNQDPLIQAVKNSFNIKNGTITCEFTYQNSYENIELASQINGNLTTIIDGKKEHVKGEINFNNNSQPVEYYIDNKGKVVSDYVKSPIAMLDLYRTEPDLSEFADMTFEPVASEVSESDSSEASDSSPLKTYSITSDQLSTELTRVLFEPIVRLGLIGAETLNTTTINGNFELTFVVDSENNQLISSSYNFRLEDEETLSDSLVITVNNSYDYEPAPIIIPQNEESVDVTNEPSEKESQA